MADAPRRGRPLIDAAEALEAALEAYQRAAHGFLKLRLDSRKSVAKAAEGLAQIARIDDELSARVGQLVAAVATLRDAQQTTAEKIQQHAQEVLARKQALEELLARLEALAGEVRDLGGSMPDDGALTSDDLDGVIQRVGQVSDSALAFATDAQARGFDDLAAEGQALRQQLLSVKNRTARMERRTPRS